MSTPMPPLEPALLLEHAQFVRALARSLVRDPGAADDIEQDTWLRALQRAPSGHADLRAWLATVMKNLLRNKARDQARRQQREERVSQSERVPSSTLAVERSDTLRKLVGAVLELEDPYRATLLSLYFEGLSANQLAQRDGVPPATVRSRHQRALAQLREKLDRSHGSREAWSVGLAHLTGLESAGGGLSVASLAAGAAVLLTLIGAGAWWLRSRPNDVATATATDLAAAATAHPPSDASNSAPQVSAAQSERSELDASQIALLGAVEDFDPNTPASGAQAARGAKLQVRLSNAQRETLAGAELSADEAGLFEWRVADPGVRPLHFEVESSAAGLFQAASARARLATDDERSARVSLRRKALADIALRVERADGSPLAQLRVGLLKSDNKTRLEAVSDAQGLVRFERASDFGRFNLLEPGWSPIDFRAPAEQADGSWTAGAIVAAASGALSVRVVDERGAPLEDASVLVARQRWELDPQTKYEWGAPLELGDTSVEVDASGVARFANVVADTDLRVRVVRGRETLLADQRTSAGELIDLERDGFAIRVPPGGEEQLVARWGERVELALSLARSDGLALGRVELTVLDTGRSSRDEHIVHDSVVEPAGAAVRITLQAPRFVGPLAVFAREVEARDELLALSSAETAGAADKTPRTLSMGSRTVAMGPDARGDDARTIELSLQLEPAGSLRGVLFGRDGAERAHRRGSMGGVRIDIVPTGVSRSAARTLLHPQTRVRYLDAARFVVHDLPPGRYDVLVAEQIANFYTFDAAEERFGPFEPGESELNLRLGAAGVVRVKLALELDTPPDEFRAKTLMAALQPREPGALDVASAPARQVIDGLAPWPLGAPLNFTGIGGELDALGRWSYGIDGRRSAGPFELPALGPGWYRFGVDVSTAQMRFAPCASPLAHYAPGEYEITLRPLRVGELRGLVRRDPTRLAALELVASDGQRAQFRATAGGSSATRRLLAPSTGPIVLHDVPHGRYELRAGTPSQLARDEFTARVDVEVNDASAVFELDLR